MFKFVVVWAVAQTVSVSPAADPYTGVVPEKGGSKEPTIVIKYQSFKSKREAEAFMDEAPVYIHKHMHLDDLTDLVPEKQEAPKK